MRTIKKLEKIRSAPRTIKKLEKIRSAPRTIKKLEKIRRVRTGHHQKIWNWKFDLQERSPHKKLIKSSTKAL